MKVETTEAPMTWREWLGVAVRGGLLLALIFVIASGIVRQSHTVEPGAAAPELHLTSLDGQSWDLARFSGKPVVVNFWATWCPPCLQEMPHFARSAKKHAADVVFIGAAVNSPPAEIVRIIKRMGVSYPVAVADDDSVNRWGANMLPSTFMLDANHQVRWSVSGSVSESELERAIEALLAEPVDASAGK